jgi:hypothetical protein
VKAARPKVAARVLKINFKRFFKWQKEDLRPVAAAQGMELNPAIVAKLC